MTETVMTPAGPAPVEYEPPYRVFAVADWATFEAKWGKLLKRADKLGVEPPRYIVLAEQTQYVYDWVQDGIAGTGVLPPWWDPEDNKKRANPYRNLRPITVRLLTLEGGTPKLAGWEFVATLQHAGEAGNILRIVPTFEETLPEEFRHSTPDRCDHCRKAIYRIATYVLRHEDGRWAQVGSTCLVDFLGGATPEGIARWAETFAAFELGGEDDDDEWWGSGYAPDTYGIEHFLQQVHAEIEAHGWVSRSAAREYDKTATADAVLDRLSRPTWFGSEDKKRPFPLTPEMAEAATAALDWVRGLEPEQYQANDFLWNLHVATQPDIVAPKTAGLVAAVFVAKKFAEEREEERRAREEARAAAKENEVTSEWFGQEKERLEFTGRVVLTLPVESFYGTSVLTKFVTDEGNVAVWFDSGSKDQFEEGGRYRVKATVKRHDERDGVKQTLINRAVALETLEEPKGDDEG